MQVDPALLSPASALLGALIGGGASLLAAVYTQRYQHRIERAAREVSKRETVYAEFIMIASGVLLNAMIHDDIVLSGDEQRMVGLINRMRLFAPPEVVGAAEAVLKAVLEVSLKPSVKLHEIAEEALAKGPEPDPLLAFSLICRRDLDDVPRTVV